MPTDDAWEMLSAAAGPTYERSEVRLQHPVVPRQILAIGLNYRSHAEESELQRALGPGGLRKAALGADR